MESEGALVPVSEVRYDLSVARSPNQVIAEAKVAAVALQNVIAQKSKPVIFNGEQYLEFEDWQTVGKFYGITSRVVSTEYVEIGESKGFTARAEAVMTSTGQVVSAAESMCMNDERNWDKKPLFQLRSMAQTRACAKSMRNILAWVVVLAGFKPSVAEEMTGDEHPSQPHQEPIKTPKPPTKDTKTTQFVPAEISIKEGEKNGKKWKKYGVKAPSGEWYGTFSESFGKLAEAAKIAGSEIEVSYTDDGKFRTIEAVKEGSIPL